MKKCVRRWLILIFSAVFLVSSGYAIKIYFDYQHEAELYQKAQDSFVTVLPTESPIATAPATTEVPPATIAPDKTEPTPSEPIETEPPEPSEPSILTDVDTSLGISVDFDALRAVNGDAIGWIYVPNTVISQPIVQSYDNQVYVRRAYDGTYSIAGSIFADYRITDDFSDRNSIIYGHNMKNATMFSTLHYYEDSAYALGHPYIYVLTPNGYLQYEVCYAMVTPSTSQVYAWDFSESGSYAEHLEMLRTGSLYNCDIYLTENDKIITLSTCTGYIKSDRFVVIARLIADVPND